MRTPLTLLAVLLLLSACTSTYDSRYRFRPHPAEVRLGDADARTLVSVVGVRNARNDQPRSVEIALRIENRGGDTLALDPATLELTSGGLERFPRPVIDPPGRIEIRPGSDAQITALFPYPTDERGDPRRLDLNGMNLRWTLERNGERIAQSATFDRREDTTRPNRSPNFGIGIGVGTVIR